MNSLYHSAIQSEEDRKLLIRLQEQITKAIIEKFVAFVVRKWIANGIKDGSFPSTTWWKKLSRKRRRHWLRACIRSGDFVMIPGGRIDLTQGVSGKIDLNEP